MFQYKINLSNFNIVKIILIKKIIFIFILFLFFLQISNAKTRHNYDLFVELEEEIISIEETKL